MAMKDHVIPKNTKVELASVTKLKPSKRNARTHSAKQVTQIANSIKEFGFVNSILVDTKQRVVAGHGRLEAAKKLGMKEVPTLGISHLTRAQIRAYMLADNKIALNAGWDNEMLAIELDHLSTEVDFDVEVTGFEMAEIDLIIDYLDVEDEELEEELWEPDEDSPPITQPGDIWLLGKHRLFCGDALRQRSYRKLLDGKRAHMVLSLIHI